MSINANNNKNIPVDTDACYEEVASQEELYLEKTEEEVVAILNSYVSPAFAKRLLHTNRYVRGARIRFGDRESDDRLNEPPMVGNPDGQLVEAAEELIAGDSDDPPLSEDSIQEMLNDSPARGSDQ